MICDNLRTAASHASGRCLQNCAQTSGDVDGDGNAAAGLLWQCVRVNSHNMFRSVRTAAAHESLADVLAWMSASSDGWGYSNDSAKMPEPLYGQCGGCAALLHGLSQTFI